MHLIFQQYLERAERRKLKPSTIKNLQRTASLFDESGLDPVTVEDWQIEEWLAGIRNAKTGEPVSPRTMRLHAENLSAMCNYGVKRRVLERSPTDDVRLPREPDKEPRIVSNADLRRLLGNCVHDEDFLLAHLAIYTGLRRAELQNLKWEDCKPTSIRVTAGKGDKLRHVPVHPALGEVLVTSEAKGEYVLRGRRATVPMSDAGIAHRLDRIRGDVDCAFHDFRRTVASSLYKNGVVGDTIDKILGWSPRVVRMRYYVNVAEDELQQAILKLYADDPLSARIPTSGY
jgi:integrase